MFKPLRVINLVHRQKGYSRDATGGGDTVVPTCGPALDSNCSCLHIDLAINLPVLLSFDTLYGLLTASKGFRRASSWRHRAYTRALGRPFAVVAWLAWMVEWVITFDLAYNLISSLNIRLRPRRQICSGSHAPPIVYA